MQWIRTNRNRLLTISAVLGGVALLLFFSFLGRAFSGSISPATSVVFYSLLLSTGIFIILGCIGTVAEIRAQKSWRPFKSLVLTALFLIVLFFTPFLGLSIVHFRESRQQRISQQPISMQLALKHIKECHVERMSLYQENGVHARLFIKPEYVENDLVAALYQDVDPAAWSNLVATAEEAKSVCGAVRVVDYRQ